VLRGKSKHISAGMVNRKGRCGKKGYLWKGWGGGKRKKTKLWFGDKGPSDSDEGGYGVGDDVSKPTRRGIFSRISEEQKIKHLQLRMEKNGEKGVLLWEESNLARNNGFEPGGEKE